MWHELQCKVSHLFYKHWDLLNNTTEYVHLLQLQIG